MKRAWCPLKLSQMQKVQEQTFIRLTWKHPTDLKYRQFKQSLKTRCATNRVNFIRPDQVINVFEASLENSLRRQWGFDHYTLYIMLKLNTVTQVIWSFHLILFNIGICKRETRRNKRKITSSIWPMRKSFTRKQWRGSIKGIFEEQKL